MGPIHVLLFYLNCRFKVLSPDTGHSEILGLGPQHLNLWDDTIQPTPADD